MKVTLPWLLCSMPLLAATQIQDTILVPFTGEKFNGNLVIAAPTMVLPNGSTATAHSKTVTVSGGIVSFFLEPNDTALPAGTSYRVQYQPGPGHGPSYVRFWIVPTSGTAVRVSQVETQTVASPSLLLLLSQLSPLGCTGGQILGILNGSVACVAPSANPPTFQTVAYSATPVFDLALAATFKITLTGNVTTETFPNILAGQTVTITICQDGTGNHTFGWAARVHGGIGVGLLPNKCSVQEFTSDGDNIYAKTLGVVNQ